MAESSFDVVSSVDLQEVKNAIAQAMKEITTRFDLKGTGSDISLQGEELVLASNDEFKLKAVRDVLETRLVKRNVPLKALTYGTVEKALGRHRAAEGHAPEGDPDREGPRDREDHQGHEAQGPGRDPGRPGPGHGQEPGRPPGRDRRP